MSTESPPAADMITVVTTACAEGQVGVLWSFPDDVGEIWFTFMNQLIFVEWSFQSLCYRLWRI